MVRVVVSEQHETNKKQTTKRNIQIEQQHFRPHAVATNGLLAMHGQLQSEGIGAQHADLDYFGG